MNDLGPDNQNLLKGTCIKSIKKSNAGSTRLNHVVDANVFLIVANQPVRFHHENEVFHWSLNNNSNNN